MGGPVETLADPGVGFTDIIKRPTAGADELRAEEYEHGREELRRKLHAAEPGTVIFTFKKTAEVLFGGSRAPGFWREPTTRGSGSPCRAPTPPASASTRSSTNSRSAEASAQAKTVVFV